MRLRSFRARLILGSLLWTAGLLAFAHLLILSFMHVFPALGRTDHHTMVLLGAILAIAGVALLRGSLTQLQRLRERLSDVREGRSPRIDGEYLSEIAPLVDDLNGLLDHRERAVKRAMTTAGDLAHGLKTPLAILAQEAERAEAAGQHELASTIAQQVERMQRQVDYHLAHARAAGSGASRGTQTQVRAIAERLARTMLRLHQREIELYVGDDIHVRCEPQDVEEMLGNLLDNACKWTRTRVVLHAAAEGDRVQIDIDDDGPGLDPSMREHVLQRGVRADEAAPGSGLGLAIVRDLAELYGGSVTLEASPMGGSQARLTFGSPQAGERLRRT
jgi:signal transduction histidine kinase